MLRQDFHRLARERVKDARALLDAKRYAAAYYLLGYAVECGLKACIAKQTKRYEFPDKKRAADCWVHDLSSLLKLSGLEAEHKKQSAASTLFETNWAIVKDWKENKRYDSSVGEKVARDLYSAVTARKTGVLAWLTNLW